MSLSSPPAADVIPAKIAGNHRHVVTAFQNAIIDLIQPCFS
jgi:hypothetical protein